MKVCKAYLKARTTWKHRYAELERRYEEAERAEQWNRAERIGEALAEMELRLQKMFFLRQKRLSGALRRFRIVGTDGFQLQNTPTL